MIHTHFYHTLKTEINFCYEKKKWRSIFSFFLNIQYKARTNATEKNEKYAVH